MLPIALISLGSLAIVLWGIGHLMASRPVLSGFESESEEYRRILLMEWVMEGLALCFVGILPASLVLTGQSSSSAGTLIL